MKSDGAKVWVFADGWLPEKTGGQGYLEAHEALMILNTNKTPANIKLDFYFDDKNPVTDIPITVEPERVACLRLDHPDDIGGVEIPLVAQYALRVRSDVEIVVQFARLDTAQSNLSYYVNVGYCC